jgi:hypothetical protein
MTDEKATIGRERTTTDAVTRVQRPIKPPTVLLDGVRHGIQRCEHQHCSEPAVCVRTHRDAQGRHVVRALCQTHSEDAELDRRVRFMKEMRAKAAAAERSDKR